MPKRLAAASLVLSLAFAGLVAQTVDSQAQSYPSRPITIVVAFPAGSATDVIARVIGRDIASQLKQPVIIENKPGGGSIIGTRYAAKAPADGYTLILGAPSSFAIAPSFSASPLNYDPIKDFEPISFVGEQSLPPCGIAQAGSKETRDIDPDREIKAGSAELFLRRRGQCCSSSGCSCWRSRPA